MAESLQRPLLLDGGLATALQQRGAALHQTLWSAGLLREAPELISGVHRDYLDAGADIITTSSYQASVPGFVSAGFSSREAESLLDLTVSLARQAVASYMVKHSGSGGSPRVAASIGPYGAYLANGSEYRGDYGVGETRLRDFHRPRIEQIVACRPDWLALETIPDMAETGVLLELLDGTRGPPAWISFCCNPHLQLHDGTPLEQAAALAHDCAAVAAIGINCMPPALATRLLEKIGAVTDKPLVVYPNSGEHYDGANKSWRGDHPGWTCEQVSEWYTLGARIIGGCCRTGPKQIADMRSCLDRFIRNS